MMTMPEASTSPSTTITILSKLFWPRQFGGLEVKAMRMAQGFAANPGVNVRVLTEHAPGLAEREELEPGIEVVRLPALAAGRLWRWSDVLRERWWRRGLERWGADGPIVAFSPMAGHAAVASGVADRMLYVPIFCQGVLPRMVKCYPEMRGLMPSRSRIRMDRRVYERTGRIAFESENQRAQFAGAYGGRADGVTVGNGVDAPSAGRVTRGEARERFGLSEDAYVVGFVGRPDACKDVGFLLRACSGVLRSHDRLLFIGDGADRPRYEREAVDLGLGSVSIWPGWLEDSTASYAAMDVMVLPSRFEMFGIVIVEAMAAGLPVIGRRRSADRRRPVLVANEELIDHERTGLLVDPHDPSDMGRRVAELRDHRARRWAMGQAARASVQGRSWTEIADRYAGCLGLSDAMIAQAGRLAA